jgi:hypothetical protein
MRESNCGVLIDKEAPRDAYGKQDSRKRAAENVQEREIEIMPVATWKGNTSAARSIVSPKEKQPGRFASQLFLFRF